MTDGMAGLNFANDIVTLLTKNWTAGAKPVFSTQWNKKVVGLGKRDYSEIIISIDAENPQIYSLLQGDSTDNTAFTYDWLHDVSLSLDVRTSVSEAKVLELVNEIMRILKTNVVPIITTKGETRSYIQVLPEGLTSLNEEYRNLFRYLVSVNCLIINP